MIEVKTLIPKVTYFREITKVNGKLSNRTFRRFERKTKKNKKKQVWESLFFGKTVSVAIKMPSTFITSGIDHDHKYRANAIIATRR